MSPGHLFLCEQALAAHRHAVLAYPIPRWQKHWREHSETFWSRNIEPLLRHATGSWFFHAFPDATPSNRVEDPKFLEHWLETQELQGLYASHVLVGLGQPSRAKEALAAAAESVGVIGDLESAFSPGLLARSQQILLGPASLALVVPPPPFRSLYLIAPGVES